MAIPLIAKRGERKKKSHRLKKINFSLFPILFVVVVFVFKQKNKKLLVPSL